MNEDLESQKYPELTDLFTRCFHPEWAEDFEKEAEVIIDFAKYKEINELLDILLEIEELKKEFPDNEKLKFSISRNLGLGYGLSLDYLNFTGVEWLDFVASIIKQELNKKKNKT